MSFWDSFASAFSTGWNAVTDFFGFDKDFLGGMDWLTDTAKDSKELFDFGADAGSALEFNYFDNPAIPDDAISDYGISSLSDYLPEPPNLGSRSDGLINSLMGYATKPETVFGAIGGAAKYYGAKELMEQKQEDTIELKRLEAALQEELAKNRMDYEKKISDQMTREKFAGFAGGQPIMRKVQ